MIFCYLHVQLTLLLLEQVTNDTVRLERKNKDTIIVKNMANLWCTSNNIVTFKIPPDDRRFVMLHCSDRYRCNTAYMNGLGSQLKRPEVARAIYQFLMGRDLSRYAPNFQNHRPQTRCVLCSMLLCITCP